MVVHKDPMKNKCISKMQCGDQPYFFNDSQAFYGTPESFKKSKRYYVPDVT